MTRPAIDGRDERPLRPELRRLARAELQGHLAKRPGQGVREFQGRQVPLEEVEQPQVVSCQEPRDVEAQPPGGDRPPARGVASTAAVADQQGPALAGERARDDVGEAAAQDVDQEVHWDLAREVPGVYLLGMLAPLPQELHHIFEGGDPDRVVAGLRPGGEGRHQGARLGVHAQLERDARRGARQALRQARLQCPSPEI